MTENNSLGSKKIYPGGTASETATETEKAVSARFLSQTSKRSSRQVRTDETLAATVLDQLQHFGYMGTTIEGVSAASGVAKTTIYRRWSSKAEMVFDLVLHRVELPPFPNTDSLVTDIHILVERSVSFVGSKLGQAVLPGLIAEMTADPELGERMRNTFIAEAHSEVTQVLVRAVNRGEIVGKIDEAGFLAALVGTPYSRIHLFNESNLPLLTAQLTEQLLRLVTTKPLVNPPDSDNSMA